MYIIEATRLYRIVNIYFHKKKVVFLSINANIFDAKFHLKCYK